MKKMLQITFAISLLFIFACSSDTSVSSDDPGDRLSATWMVTGMTAYDDEACTDELFDYGSTGRGLINPIFAETAADCQNLEWFFSATADGDAAGADFAADTFCGGEDSLHVTMYMQMNSADSLDTEAAGTYVKTMYATMQNGKNHVNEYSTYGRFFTFGVNMVTQILAKIDTEPLDGNNEPTGADRFTLALEDATDERSWTFNNENAFSMQWVDSNGADNDLAPSCVMISYSNADDYHLRGCTDELAINYMGGDSNIFELAATEETGNCVYTADEASQGCIQMSHDDLDGDGMYEEDEMVTYAGVIDCAGDCKYEAASAWVGDGICDGAGGTRAYGEYNCEAFNWDGWDCACAADCISTYDATAGTAGSVDGTETSQVGEGNDILTTYTDANCQAACNVEDCGYDIGDLNNTSTWDCCPATCIQTAGAAIACNDDCNIGACDWFRNAATNVAADIGLCCDQTGPDATAGTADDIDCAALAGNGSCDEACNTGACNNDGGDCD